MPATRATQTLQMKSRRSFRETHFRWTWTLKSSPSVLWRYVANTDRFNRDTQVPSVTMEGSPMENHRRRLKMHRFTLGALKLVPIEWTENPFEWIKPERFGVVRNYSKGPVAYMRTLTELKARADGGTDAVYEVWAVPRNLLGVLAIPFQIGLLSAGAFRRAFFRYDKMAQEQRVFETEKTVVRPALVPGGKARLEKGQAALQARGIDPGLALRLVALIQLGDEMSLTRMRPYALADAWKTARRPMLEMFLHATRIGLLDSRWELLCPLCRGAKASATTLGEINPQVHCDVCQIDYQVNFEQSVELVFKPNSSVRPIDEATYCIGGPQITPHILLQSLVAPGRSVTFATPTEMGRYRVRTALLMGGQYLHVDMSGRDTALLRAQAKGWEKGEAIIHPGATITFENATDAEQLFMFERMAWSDQAATAAAVTTLQLFRDLFGHETLRSDVQIGVGSLTMMFTDLRSSTAMYREMGDARAFGMVMSHFEVLKRIIDEHGGAIIKTNGDAAMAVFRRPINAIRAAVATQIALALPTTTLKPLALKIGLHSGSCIAVNLNERLDYFGSVVNIAARLESLSSGEDIVISQEVYLDPEVVDYFSRTQEIGITSFKSTLKGFDEQRFELWRLTTAAPDIRTVEEY